MTIEDLTTVTRTVTDIMIEMFERDDERAIWGSDLGMGCAIGSASLFRHLFEIGGCSPVLICGTYDLLSHAFVIVDLDDHRLVADPTFMQFDSSKPFNVTPFEGDIRKGTCFDMYSIQEFTREKKHIHDLFEGWEDQCPGDEQMGIVSEIRERTMHLRRGSHHEL